MRNLKEALSIIIADGGFIPDQESFDLFQKIVPWPAVEVCVLNSEGKLLLQNRHYTEWPGEWSKIHDWYIPGGFMKTEDTFEESCKKHIVKDGIFGEIELIGICGALKWAEGEHPTSLLISIVCACRLKGEISFRPGTEKDFRFVGEVVPTTVPNHTKLQEIFFKWRDENLNLFK